MAVKQYYPVFFSFKAFWHKAVYFSVFIQGYVRLRKQNSHSIYIYYYYILYILPYSQQLGLYTCFNHLFGKGFFPFLVLYDVTCFVSSETPPTCCSCLCGGGNQKKIGLGRELNYSVFDTKDYAKLGITQSYSKNGNYNMELERSIKSLLNFYLHSKTLYS